MPYHGHRYWIRTVIPMTVPVALPEALYQQLEAEATRRGVPVNDLIAEWLQLLVQQSSLATPRPLPGNRTFFDVMQDCCGIDEDMPRPWWN